MSNLKQYSALTIFCLGLLFTSCSKEEISVQELSSNITIGFLTDVNDSKSIIIDDDNYKEFAISAYYTKNKEIERAIVDGEISKEEPNFMKNQLVSRASVNAAWSYSPIKYWSNNINDLYSFYAVYPYKKEVVPTLEGFVFEQDNNILTQVDLIAAKGENIKRGGAVELDFTHKLSKIGFALKNISRGANSKITIKSLSISTSKSSLIKSGGAYKYSSNSWVLLGGKSHFFTHNPTFLSGIKELNLGEVIKFEGDDFFFLIPQQVQQGALVVEIVYTSGTGVQTTEKQVQVLIPATDWQISKSYLYTIGINATNPTTTISFEVTAWDKYTTNDNIDNEKGI